MRFTVIKSELLNGKLDNSSFNKEIILGKVEILGLKEITKLFLNGSEIEFSYNAFTSVSIESLQDYKNNDSSSIEDSKIISEFEYHWLACRHETTVHIFLAALDYFKYVLNNAALISRNNDKVKLQ